MASTDIVLKDEIQSAILFFLLMLITSAIAYYKGFYKLEKDEKVPITYSYGFFVFLIYAVTIFLIGPLVVRLFKNLMSNTNILGFVFSINLALNLFLILVLYLFCFRVKKDITLSIIKRGQIDKTTLKRDVILGVLSWLIAFPLVSFFSSIFDILVYFIFKVTKVPNQLAIEFIKSSLKNPIFFVMALISVIVIAPIIEEFLFRGVLQNLFKKFMNRSLAILATSVIFAFFHFAISQKLANITILGSLFILGVFLSFLYEKQKSLISPIFLHATFNALSVLNIIFIKGV
ncbi:MAG: hypothetical protein KR126chlam6_00046 [Candidatus Anoxychlamydiales bacterium]|nr:hypothetical protein [Candidatus Anoxychlamydiales bacterium]